MSKRKEEDWEKRRIFLHKNLDQFIGAFFEKYKKVPYEELSMDVMSVIAAIVGHAGKEFNANQFQSFISDFQDEVWEAHEYFSNEEVEEMDK